MSDLAAGQILGRYELLLPVAKGGMAQVWAARLRGSRGFQKIVAIKTILAGAIDDARMEQMFLEEASLASQIHHPNVVGTLELGEHDESLYIVMEWVDGESLGFVMSRAAESGGIPLPIAVNLVGQACKGLHAAHELRDDAGELLGVVHRDVSAQNVLVTYSGTAKLVDFGIAKATARSSNLTEAGEIKGKFAYMSPEQIYGQALDRRTDIFGMGVILYLLTTGCHPFKGANPAETMQNVGSNKPPIRPSELVEGYPLELEAVLMKALAKLPGDRWSTAHEMLAALEQAMPQSMEGSFELQVAAYMHQLLGQRSSDRRMQLRLAQQLADKSRGDVGYQPGPGSYSSLRAITVDQTDSGAMSSRRPARSIIVEAPPPPVAILMPARKRSFAQPVMIAAGVIAFAMAVSLSTLKWLGPAMGAHNASATSPVPAEIAETQVPATAPAQRAAVAPAPERTAVTPAPAPPSAVSARPSAPPVQPASDQAAKRVTRKPATIPPSRPASAPVTVLQPAPILAPFPILSAAPVAVPEKPRTEVSDAPANPWDNGSFGARQR